ncbi:tRNA (adenine(22)-N(1))-methyltransferase [Pectinatus brassicae]|uniref:tRNA (Adenine22-N1)-methyltransferase n=1 Tax=Pectinatus brassicae TaxID=862415 RepID=A0A840URQ2_9FIRM|nr:class I SAM-dependent methyltransferase [Pectinatus brassicae]MBB5337428.1 tRNA (adenine22-N1)-methyltransferase [Pectinatus brassicae]
MTPRLRTVASFVPEKSSIIDIGTDHALIPMYLLKNKRITHAIAVDVNPGPYETAKQAIYDKNLQAYIDVRLGNGLTVVKENEADIAIFAGMGGILINKLLQQSPQIVKNLKGLIVQPQLAAEKLRQYLYEIGWHINNEALAKEQDHIYQIIYALPGTKPMPSYLELEIGPILLQNKPPLFKFHIEELLRRHKKILKGMQESTQTSNLEELNKKSALIKDLEMMKTW